MTPDETEELILQTWDFSDPKASHDAFKAHAERVGTSSLPGMALLTQAARALGLQGYFSGAAASLDQIETEVSSFTDTSYRQHAQARLAIERGRVLTSAGDPSQARPYFEAALGHAEKAGATGLVIDALHMLAIVASEVDAPEDAVRWNQRALVAAESSDAPAARSWRAPLLNNLGWVYHDNGQHAAALEHFERALAAREESGTPYDVAVAFWTVARALRALRRYPEALEIQEVLADDPLMAEDGYVHEERGELYLEMSRLDEARACFARAFALLSHDDHLVRHEPDRLERLHRLATQG